jgi:hypothetical protein
VLFRVVEIAATGFERFRLGFVARYPEGRPGMRADADCDQLDGVQGDAPGIA